MTAAAVEAKKLLASNVEDDKARFTSSIGANVGTSDLLAMLEQAKLKDREREEAIAKRRAELSKEAFAKRREEEQAMIEEPEAVKWVGPAPWELAAAAREAALNNPPPVVAAAAASALIEPDAAGSERAATTTNVASSVKHEAAPAAGVLPSPLSAVPKASASAGPPLVVRVASPSAAAAQAKSASPAPLPAASLAAGAAAVSVANMVLSEHTAMQRAYEMKLDALNDLLTSMQSCSEQLVSDKEELAAQLVDARAKVDALDRQLVEQMQPKQMLGRGQLITKEELVEVRSEIQMQERIVKVLEKENEMLLVEKKTLALRVKALEKGQIDSDAKQNFSSNAAVGKTNNNHNTSTGSLPQSLNTSAIAHGGGGNVGGPSLPELNLQLQRSKTTEAELRVELDTLKRQKKDLEMKFASVDLQLVEEAKLDARNATATLKRKDLEYTSNVADMARKIAWYVEHQEFNTAQADLLKERETTIHQLRLKLHEMESLVTKSGVVRTDKDRQIKNLQRRALELEEALRAKNPDSIAELIRSVQPSFEQSTRYKQLDTEIADLKQQLARKDKECEGIVDRLRVETDRLRTAYNSRIEKLEDEMKLRVLNAQSRKVKELEKTLTDTRKYYTDKVKEQEHAIVLLRRGVAVSATTSSGAAGSNAEGAVGADGGKGGAMNQRPANVAAAAKRGGSVTGAGTSKHDDGGSSLPAASGDPAAAAAAAAAGDAQAARETASLTAAMLQQNQQLASAAALAPALLSLQSENLSLKKQLEAMVQQAMQLAATPSVAATSFGLASSLQAQLSSLAGELALHKRLLAEAQDMTRKSSVDWEDRLLLLRRDHAKELQLLRGEHDSEITRQCTRHDTELKLAMAKQEQLLQQMAAQANASAAGRSSLSAKGVQGYLEAVATKLQLLEHRQLAREAETEREIAEIRRVASFETALERQKLALAVEEKNQEILAFKWQLDHLLTDLALLRNP